MRTTEIKITKDKRKIKSNQRTLKRITHSDSIVNVVCWSHFWLELLGLPWEGGPQGGVRLTGGGGTKGTTNRLQSAFKPIGARARVGGICR